MNKGVMVLSAAMIGTGVILLARRAKAEPEIPEVPEEPEEPEEPEVPPELVNVYMPPKMDVSITGDGDILGMYWQCNFKCPITNMTAVSLTTTIAWEDNVEVNVGSKEIVLTPYGSYEWSLSQLVDFRRVPVYQIELVGDWPEDNRSVGTAKP